jgi:hypothetical protein
MKYFCKMSLYEGFLHLVFRFPQQIQIGNTDFTNKKIRQQSIFINGTQVPYANIAKYLVMTLDASNSGKSKLRRKASSASSSGKCIGCFDAIVSSQSTINSYYTSMFMSSLESWYPVLELHQ